MQGTQEGGAASRLYRAWLQHSGWRGRRGHIYFLHPGWRPCRLVWRIEERRPLGVCEYYIGHRNLALSHWRWSSNHFLTVFSRHIELSAKQCTDHYHTAYPIHIKMAVPFLGEWNRPTRCHSWTGRGSPEERRTNCHHRCTVQTRGWVLLNEKQRHVNNFDHLLKTNQKVINDQQESLSCVVARS